MVKTPGSKNSGVFYISKYLSERRCFNCKTNLKSKSKGGHQRIFTHKGLPDSLSTSTKDQFISVLIFCSPSPYLSPSITGCLPAEREKLINIKTKLNIKEKAD